MIQRIMSFTILITKSKDRKGDYMSMYELSTWAFQIYADILVIVLPVAIAFGIGNLCCNMFLSASFGGKIKIAG